MTTTMWEILIVCSLVGLILGGVFRVNVGFLAPVIALGLILIITLMTYRHGSVGDIMISAVIGIFAPGMAYFIGLFIKGLDKK